MRYRRLAVSWGIAFAIWTLVGLSYAFAMVANARTRGWPMTWPAALGWNLPSSYLWMVLSPIPIAIANRVGFEARTWKRALAVHLPAGLVVAVVHHVIFLSAYWWLGSPLVTKGEPLSLTISLPWRLHDALIVYAMIVLTLYVLHHVRHRQQLESQLARSQLAALRMQLQPHFLFNTLNAISALVVADPPQAKTMIAKLGDFLRLTLDDPNDLAVPLRQELRLIEGYLEIQRMRFQDRVTVMLDAPDDVLAVLVPHLVLQPLVENAFRHGIARKPGPGFVGVRGSRRGETLVIEDEDDGHGLPDVIAEGVGLRNTRARLHAHYGATATFELCGRAGGGTLATITVPTGAA